MNSTTSLVARQYRLKQWAEQIRDCQNRPREMSTIEWCKQHDITTANYYYRLREVRKACLEQISLDDLPQTIVPVPAELIKNSVQPSKKSGLEITLNNICIHVTGDTTSELLKMVLQVANDVK